VQDGWYDDNDYDDFDIAEHQRKEDPMSEQTEQASVPVTMTAEERVIQLYSMYNLNYPIPRKIVVLVVDRAMREAEHRGYVKGLLAAKNAIEGNDYEGECRHSITLIIQQAEAQTSPAKGDWP
jgi:hypothetical protein